jgi:hypothetical protein
MATIQMIAIAEGVLLAVCIGLLLRAWWWIGIKNGALQNYIRREKEQIGREIAQERLRKEKEAAAHVETQDFASLQSNGTSLQSNDTMLQSNDTMLQSNGTTVHGAHVETQNLASLQSNNPTIQIKTTPPATGNKNI